MALRNGLLVHGPTHWAAAVRNDAGAIEVASGRKPRLRAADPVPGVRGVVRLGRGVRRDPAGQARAARGAAAVPGPGVLAVAAGASLGGTLLRRRAARRRRRGGGGADRRFMPALFALRGGELAAYHGVEHKAIGAYEADADDAARRDQGARPLRLAPRRADARLQPRGHGAAAARGRAAGPARRRRGRARVVGRRGRGLRLVRAPRRDAAPRGRSSARASRSSAWSARASPTSASSRSAARRSPRSCAPRASPERLTIGRYMGSRP